MKKRLDRILGVVVMLLVMGMTVSAADADNIKKNAVLQTNSDVELREGPDESSEVTATLPSGTPVIIKEDAKDGWCMVAYREDMGYVQISFLGLLGSQAGSEASGDQDVAESAVESNTEQETASQNIDNISVLDAEMKKVQEENLMAYQEAETAKEQAASEKKWGIVIAVLVIAIFAVGITTTLVGNKGKKK